MILLTYLQRKTQILLSVLINISDVWRLGMKKVVGCEGEGKGTFRSSLKHSSVLPTQSGSSCAYRGLVLEFGGALNRAAPSPPLAQLNHPAELLQTRCWVCSLLPPSREDWTLRCSMCFNRERETRVRSRFWFTPQDFLFHSPWICLALGPQKPGVWLPQGRRQNVLSFFFLISYLKMHSGKRKDFTLAAIAMPHITRGTHLNVTVGELKELSSYRTDNIYHQFV